ncbi:MAG TPA: serine/threonine-protein kinase, partial [Gemmatimonadales bacterium]|nr:serine/threonine-protein kinase [Gemmatimonadales bacterium]
MGVVFLGRDVALDRPVAIKVLRPEAATAVAAERFLREARLLARLQHPHVVQVHQAGESAGLFYFVMDLVEGETLAGRLARGPLAHVEAVGVADQLLDALESAHRLGIIHRDIKPSNIFLTGRGVRLGDFGIARGTGGDEDQALTRESSLLGTPAYMAPEQAGGGPVTAATDLYAVGLVLYECLTGRRWSRFADPGQADWSGVPGQVRGPLARALALSPGERWPGTETFRRALRPRSRLRPLVMAAGAVVLALLLFLAWRSRSATPADSTWSVGDAAPRTVPGRSGFDRAERLYRNGIWDSVGVAFAATVAVDSTCLICVFRLVDVDRWLENPPDRTRLAYLMEVRDQFPQPYRELIEAQALDGRARLD